MEHLEGRESVLAALRSRRRRFEVVLLSDRIHEERIADVMEAAAELGVPVKRVPPEQLDLMAHGRTHGGVAAVCTPRVPDPEGDLLALLAKSEEPPFLVLVEGVEDSRNLGFVIRSAEAFGAHAVLVKKHAWDFDSADVSRTSAGAFERMTLLRLDRESELLGSLKKRGIRIVACVPSARRAIFDADLARPLLLAVGGEKRGLSAAVRKSCDRFVSIPMKPGSTSLSLTHAAAVAIGEVMRQRRAAPPARDVQAAGGSGASVG